MYMYMCTSTYSVYMYIYTQTYIHVAPKLDFSHINKVLMLVYLSQTTQPMPIGNYRELEALFTYTCTYRVNTTPQSGGLRVTDYPFPTHIHVIDTGMYIYTCILNVKLCLKKLEL